MQHTQHTAPTEGATSLKAISETLGGMLAAVGLPPSVATLEPRGWDTCAPGGCGWVRACAGPGELAGLALARPQRMAQGARLSLTRGAK
jgi:hypothetical protein